MFCNKKSLPVLAGFLAISLTTALAAQQAGRRHATPPQTPPPAQTGAAPVEESLTLSGRLEAGDKDAQGNAANLYFLADDDRVFRIDDSLRVTELSAHVGHNLSLTGRIGDMLEAQLPEGLKAFQPAEIRSFGVESFKMISEEEQK